MKIAFINLYQHHVARGGETYVNELSKRLSKKHTITIFGGEEEKIDWRHKDMSQTFSRRLFMDYWSRKIALYTLKLIPTIWKEKYDIVIPVNGGWQSAFIRLVTWIYGGKMVISGQSGIGWDDRNNLLSFPNVFVALSDYQKKWAQRVNPFVKIVKIANGVDLSLFRLSKKGAEIDLPRPLILCVAALTKWKRLDLAIKAVAGIKRGSLLLVGQGPESENLLALGEKLLPKRFKIISISHDKIPTIYSSADLFTYPTVDAESFGIVLVEAMASGLPVVTTNDPIRKEIVGEAGIFVDPTNSENYANALTGALSKKWHDIPRKQAKKFSWDDIAKDYDQLFESLNKKSI